VSGKVQISWAMMDGKEVANKFGVQENEREMDVFNIDLRSIWLQTGRVAVAVQMPWEA
jgi:hypothetical protein